MLIASFENTDTLRGASITGEGELFVLKRWEIEGASGVMECRNFSAAVLKAIRWVRKEGMLSSGVEVTEPAANWLTEPDSPAFEMLDDPPKESK